MRHDRAGRAGLRRWALWLWAVLSLGSAAFAEQPTRADYLEIAEQGWVFEFRSSIKRRQADLPPVRLSSQEIVEGPVCLIGEAPHDLTRTIIHTFDRLLETTFGQIGPVNAAGRDLASCPPGTRTYMRLYGGAPPQYAFNADLRALDRRHDIGLPEDREWRIQSPAQANAFFGRNGTAVYILVKQPARTRPSELERRFFRSILIEELYQAFTYGMDILIFDRKQGWQSKLQEYPVNLRALPWDSERFMTGLVNSNPKGLCAFDVFILHALANSGQETANSPEFLSYLQSDFDALLARAETTLADPEFANILDPECREMPE